MDFKLFFIGVGRLKVVYLICRNVKNDMPSLEKTNWNASTLSNYRSMGERYFVYYAWCYTYN